jgi:hypothetical protein
MMKFRSHWSFAAVFGSLMVVLLSYAWPMQAAEPSAEKTLVKEIRAALAARDFEMADAKLKEAIKLAEPAEPGEELVRLQTLLQLSNEFWSAVLDGAKTLRAADELVIGDTRTAFVEFDGSVFVMRVNGKNVRYNRQSVPAKVALTLAERVLKPGDANNKAIIGAFLLSDGKGSRDLAAKYLNEARQGGADVDVMLPELDVPPTIVLDVPPMTPIMQKVLAPASWMLHTLDGKKIDRNPLGDSGKLNEDGRLVVSLPETATGPAQVMFGRKVAGDFRCRFLLENVTAGQRLGLFSPSNSEETITLKLPADQVQVELARQGDKLQCKLNGADAKLETSAVAKPRMPGLLGVELLPGQSCTILWFELVGR